MEEEFSKVEYETSQTVRGMIITLKKLGYSNRATSEQLTTWGHPTSHMTVSNIWNRFLETGSVET